MIKDILLSATMIGLLMDVIGFVLVFLYGHFLFLRSGSKEPDNGEGRDGDLYFRVADVSPELDRKQARRRFLAKCGAYLVIAGFGLQALGAWAELYL